MVTKVYVAVYTESCGESYWVMFVNAKGEEMSPYKTKIRAQADSEADAWSTFFGLTQEK